ncbi:hypothetical protein [Actinoplanes sp. HUAS TT8]|uniref:hypothetical protein n=1 Tax=Actinoplanes sp. HUAS TT8 TaxID=3447453 RepID=UPI003F51DDF9
MALVIYVENQCHERGRAVADDGANTFLNLARRLSAAGTQVLDIIDPYTDAMLNVIQLDRLCRELDAALTTDLSDTERALATAVRAAAAEAREQSGYLFIEGD